MSVTAGIGLDSQCLSYIIDAMQGIEEPKDNLAAEKIALFRTYLYTEGTLFVTPTVRAECMRIKEEGRRAQHESFINVLFGEWPLPAGAELRSRVADLLKHHPNEADCRILAEAELAGFTTLLTYDDKFLGHLSNQSRALQLMRPSELWHRLSIPRGASPRKLPHSTNPLVTQGWYTW